MSDVFILASGGGPRRLVAKRATATDWGERGEILFIRDNAIWRSTSAGDTSLVARPDSGSGATFSSAMFLPGDRTVVFTISARDGGQQPTSVAVVNVDNGKITPLGIEGRALGFANGFLLVGQQGALVAFPFSPRDKKVTSPPVPLADGVQQSVRGISAAASDEGTLVFGGGGYGRRTVLVAVDRRGQERVLAEPRLYSWPRVSPDGRRVAVEVGGETGGYDVWVLDLASKALSRLTTNNSGVRPFGWSRDGKQVGFLATAFNNSLGQGTSRQVAWIPWDLSGPRQLLPTVSKDGVEDASVSSANGSIAMRVLGYGAPGDLLLAPADSPRVAQPLVATSADEETPRFSPMVSSSRMPATRPAHSSCTYVR